MSQKTERQPAACITSVIFDPLKRQERRLIWGAAIFIDRAFNWRYFMCRLIFQKGDGMGSLTVRLIPTVPKIVLEQLPPQKDGSITILVSNIGDPRLPEGGLRPLVLITADADKIAIGQRNIYEIGAGYNSVSIETNFGRSKGQLTTYYLSLLLTVMGPKGIAEHRVDCGSFQD